MALPAADLEFILAIDMKLNANFPDLRRMKKSVANLNALAGKRNTGAFKFVKKQADDKLAGFQQILQKRLNKIPRRTEVALKEVMEFIRDESKKLTPVDTEALRNSAFAVVERGKVTVRGKVGYSITSGDLVGGATDSVDYAVFVHELNNNHDPGSENSRNSNPSGQWKFLQTAVEQNQKDIPRMLARKMGKI